jgi:hypothetical protein
LKTVIELLFEHELQFRVFGLQEVTDCNTMAHSLDVTFTDAQKEPEIRAVIKGIVDLSALLRFFNVRALTRLEIQPAQQTAE